MNKYASFALMAMLAAGCASQGQMRDVEDTTETNQKLLRENEYRLNTLENSVTALNSQIAQLNNRVYEVRTKSGQRTSMTVVPITGVANPPGSPAPVASAAQKAAPRSRAIDPAAKPAPMPARTAPTKNPVPAPASANIASPQPVAGPSGQIASQNDDLALPPADLPPQLPASNHVTSFTAPANTGTVQPPLSHTSPEVPVPVIPATDLSLPPEHPGLPPIETAQAPATQTPVAPAQAAAPVRANPANARGEEAAYKAALNAARSGHTEEGIRLFRNFLQQYPNGRYTANAEYWIGECLYSQGKYQDALSEFNAVNNSYPKHHKNADALLKAGLTLSRMGDKAGAQEKFKTLLQTFPNSDAARRARSMGGVN